MSQEKIQVLLIEDDAAHAELIRRAFEDFEAKAGLIHLTVAQSLEEARTCLTESLPDLAIVDLFLPDGKGMELLSEEPDEPRYPVVVITAHGDEEVAVEAMKAGALQYVVKSEANLAELPHKVETALRQWSHIIERRHAEEALQASEAHFRSLIENAQDVITVVDKEGTVAYASPALERVLGYPPEEAVGGNVLDHIHPEDREDFTRQLRRAFSDPETTPVLVYRQRHRDGSWRHLEGIWSCHRQKDGEWRAVMNSRDITERIKAEAAKKQLEDRLRQAQRREMIGNLAGDIANEFYNLLTPILESATMALQNARPGTKIRTGLERVLKAVNRSRDLAEQILIFSRQGAPRRKPLQLAVILDEVIDLLQASVPSNIEIRTHIDEGCESVAGDAPQLHRAVMNVCRNAYQAMRATGGVLEVSLRMVEVNDELLRQHPGLHPGPYARLTVSDTGPGMDPATRERAFEPFFTTRGVGKSTGLGLPVAHGIVASHGGEMTLESDLGKGTRVSVYLPAGAAESSS